jgi:hypothetical protein
VCDISFKDVKPGDYGCFNWTITVDNNPAWVASCIDIVSDTDGKAYEPESEIEDSDGDDEYEIQSHNYDPVPPFEVNFDTSGNQGSTQSERDLYGALGPGELAEQLLVLPYYDDDASCMFFDSGGPTNPLEDIGELVTPTNFWSNSQLPNQYKSNPFPTKDGDKYYIAPRTVRGASIISAKDTAHWKSAESNTLEIENAPKGTDVGQDSGCVMLEGDIATGDSDPSNNTQGVSALQPGKNLQFGYDWHLPFGTGNEAMGDELEVSFSFLFLQKRHTEAPDFGTYSPGSNTPS